MDQCHLYTNYHQLIAALSHRKTESRSEKSNTTWPHELSLTKTPESEKEHRVNKRSQKQESRSLAGNRLKRCQKLVRETKRKVGLYL